MARPSFTDKQKVLVYEAFNGKCADCHLQLLGSWHVGGYATQPKRTFTIYNAEIDHIIPVTQGGKHCLSNWALRCVACHHKKTFVTGLLRRITLDLVRGLKYGQSPT